MGVLNSAYYNIVNLHLNIFVITTIGVYGTRPPLPAVGGGEGVGVVTSVGEQVTTLSKGDHVVIAKPGIGKNLLTTNQDAAVDMLMCDVNPADINQIQN